MSPFTCIAIMAIAFIAGGVTLIALNHPIIGGIMCFAPLCFSASSKSS